MNSPNRKLSDLIDDKLLRKESFFSIEIFPPKTENDLTKLYINLENFLKKFKPLFCDITYHSTSQKPVNHPCSSFSIASKLCKLFYI